MFENTSDFMARIQKKKLMAEQVDVKQTTGSIKATGKDLGSDMEGRTPDMKPKRAKENKQPAKTEDQIEHSIKQCSPESGKPSKGSVKISKPRPAKDLTQPKDAKDTVKHSIKQCEPNSKNESLNESIFILAGIEDILTSDEAKRGAVGALDIIKGYMGSKIDPVYQNFIDMFTGVIKGHADNTKKVNTDVVTRGQVINTKSPKKI